MRSSRPSAITNPPASVAGPGPRTIRSTRAPRAASPVTPTAESNACPRTWIEQILLLQDPPPHEHVADHRFIFPLVELRVGSDQSVGAVTEGCIRREQRVAGN